MSRGYRLISTSVIELDPAARRFKKCRRTSYSIRGEVDKDVYYQNRVYSHIVYTKMMLNGALIFPKNTQNKR